MTEHSVELGVSFVGVVLGLVILLVAEAVGAGEVVIAAGGAVAILGVAILTAVVMRLPEPADADSDHEHGHA
ncbi:hypothetical protein [Haloferax larsenii]|uniref:Uncharacterized protein n=1 Tax=Haloferax larsenii TaxID=302484 RepID=A0A1H7SIL7_HALLR|nr:hypothetical protein [Haloferax larsenii]SEL72472.1 hypothetical protein SAMN04488691_10799 [Haloferax larsenii]